MRKRDFEMLVDKEKYQVFFFECPAFIPVNFATHPWFVLNKKGELSRWEVLMEKNFCPTSWEHLHLNVAKPYQGVGIFPYFVKIRWRSTFRGVVEGKVAEKMITYIEDSPQNYPHCKRYKLTGPNSNTYAQMILDRFPEARLFLSPRAFGKSFK